MTAYDVMLSESQERMLIVVRLGEEESVREVLAALGANSTVIGQITASGRFVVRDGDSVVSDLPLEMLIDEVPTRQLEARAPEGLDELRKAGS